MPAPEQIMQLVVNGRPREVAAGSTVAELVEAMGLDRRFLVVEHNGEALGREELDRRQLAEGDRLELVRPVAGG